LSIPFLKRQKMKQCKDHYPRYLLLFVVVGVFIYNPHNSWAVEEKSLTHSLTSPRIFSTWEGFEVDKCAAIWLIKKFIDSKAQFKFFPKGEIITEGIPFDTPDAKLRRDRNQSTFESIATKYAVTDNVVIKIGKIIYDIEVNVWGKKVYQDSMKIKRAIRDIIDTSENNEEILQKSDAYFDNLYKILRNQIAAHLSTSNPSQVEKMRGEVKL